MSAHRDDNNWILRALCLVDRRGIGQDELVQLSECAFDGTTAEADRQSAALHVEVAHDDRRWAHRRSGSRSKVSMRERFHPRRSGSTRPDALYCEYATPVEKGRWPRLDHTVPFSSHRAAAHPFSR
jgi:hypothetical protein